MLGDFACSGLVESVIFSTMCVTAPPPPCFAAAPEMARRFGFILGALAALVARGLLRQPRYVAVIPALWSWLNRSVQRFGRAVARPGRVRAVEAAAVAGPAGAVARVRAARLRLPAGRGWLVRALGYEAAGYGSQLEALLAEPEMAGILAAAPAVGRILRPLCRMLGVGAAAGLVVARVRKARAARAGRVRVPRAERRRLLGWSPGPIREDWWPQKRG